VSAPISYECAHVHLLLQQAHGRRRLVLGRRHLARRDEEGRPLSPCDLDAVLVQARKLHLDREVLVVNLALLVLVGFINLLLAQDQLLVLDEERVEPQVEHLDRLRGGARPSS